MAYSDADRAKAIELLEHHTLRDVAKVIGCSHKTIRRWSGDAGAIATRVQSRQYPELRPSNNWGERYVYLIRESFAGLVKIGIAKDLSARIASMQAGCPQELTLIGYVLTANARRIERNLHVMYVEKNYRGEWFSLSDCEIDAIVQEWAALDSIQTQPRLF